MILQDTSRNETPITLMHVPAKSKRLHRIPKQDRRYGGALVNRKKEKPRGKKRHTNIPTITQSGGPEGAAQFQYCARLNPVYM